VARKKSASVTTEVQFLRRVANEKCPRLGNAWLWRKACPKGLRTVTRNRFATRRQGVKTTTFVGQNRDWKQNATKVIKKVERQNLSRNELTFGHEHGVLVVTKGLEWKANSTFR
jgi:hypothetical protein